MKTIVAVFLLICFLSVAGCTGRVEPTGLSVLKLGASRDQVEAALGQPCDELAYSAHHGASRSAG